MCIDDNPFIKSGLFPLKNWKCENIYNIVSYPHICYIIYIWFVNFLQVKMQSCMGLKLEEKRWYFQHDIWAVAMRLEEKQSHTQGQ